MSNSNYKNLRLVLLCALIGGITAYYGLYHRWRLHKEGKFTLAEYIGTSTGGRQGSSDKYLYRFQGKDYYTFIKVYNDKRYLTYKFCKFVPSQPNICQIFYDLEVPYCITNDSIPFLGWWDTLPTKKACHENKDPLFTGRIELHSRKNSTKH